MATLSINEVTTYRWSFEEDVANCQRAGISAIGVWRQKLSDFGEDKGVELLAEYGLRVSNLLWAGGFTGSDGRTFQDSVEDASDAVRVAAELGCPPLVIYTGGQAGHILKHARRLVTQALDKLLPLAESVGVTLAIEPMHAGCAGDWTFLTGLEDTLNLIDDISSPRLQIVLDTYHLGHDPTLISRIGELIDRIAVVHLGDGREPPHGEQNRARLGSGVIPLADIIAALETAGYDGCYDVELVGEDIESRNYRELTDDSKQAFDALLAGRPAPRNPAASA